MRSDCHGWIGWLLWRPYELSLKYDYPSIFRRLVLTENKNIIKFRWRNFIRIINFIQSYYYPLFYEFVSCAKERKKRTDTFTRVGGEVSGASREQCRWWAPFQPAYVILDALQNKMKENKAGYTATEVTCGWAGAKFEVTRPFGQEQWGKKK